MFDNRNERLTEKDIKFAKQEWWNHIYEWRQESSHVYLVLQNRKMPILRAEKKEMKNANLLRLRRWVATTEQHKS